MGCGARPARELPPEPGGWRGGYHNDGKGASTRCRPAGGTASDGPGPAIRGGRGGHAADCRRARPGVRALLLRRQPVHVGVGHVRVRRLGRPPRHVHRRLRHQPEALVVGADDDLRRGARAAAPPPPGRARARARAAATPPALLTPLTSLRLVARGSRCSSSSARTPPSTTSRPGCASSTPLAGTRGC